MGSTPVADPVGIRLLVNAEPFGFGPAAAAVALAGRLRGRVGHLTYAGVGHTLDLQGRPPFDEIHDMTGADGARWHELVASHDAVLTAMDFRVAGMALEAGVPVALYDALAWHWDEIPAVAAGCLYVVQDFLGVRERLSRDAHLLGEVEVVPPIVERVPGRIGEIVLLNLGGLQNPFWDAAVPKAYARALLGAVDACLPRGTHVEVACSGRVAAALGDRRAGPRTPAEVQDLMHRSAFAFMTPGLGNIMDAAAHGLPTAWLPPANYSQGQQLELIAAGGLADASLDWAVLGRAADYRLPQAAAMAEIGERVTWLSTPGGRQALHRAAAEAAGLLAGREASCLGRLLNRLGSGGAEVAASAVIAWLGRGPQLASRLRGVQ